MLFGAVAWALGPHWGVPGMCVLGATVLAVAAIELDGLAPPASVSLVGTGLGAVLAVRRGVADRRWWHLGGMWIGIAVAVGVATYRDPGEPERRGATLTPLWALIPAGAVHGLGRRRRRGGRRGDVGRGSRGCFGVPPHAHERAARQGRSKVLGPRPGRAVGSAAALVSAFLAGSSIGP